MNFVLSFSQIIGASFLDHVAFALFLLVWIMLLLGLSKFVERIWVTAIGFRPFRFFVAPGVIIHEYSHALACLITGAKIHEIKLFKKEGGHVKHEPPKWPPKFTFFSKVLISFAPVVGCILVMWFLIFAFQQITGVDLSEQTKTVQKTEDDGKQVETEVPIKQETPESVWGYVEQLLSSTWYKIINITKPIISPKSNVILGIIFLWLLLSMTVGMAPSAQDFRNSFIGVIILIILVFVISWGMTVAGDKRILFEVLAAMRNLVSFTLAVMAFAVVISLVIAAPLRVLLRSSS